jgi:two-component system phosphate regulon sensor histidine kinase PhoR
VRRLFWRIFATYLIVVVLCTVAVGYLAVRSARDFYLDRTAEELAARATLVREEVASLGALDASDLQGVLARLAEAADTRITVISAGLPGPPSGEVLADSGRDPSELENHGDRPEFRTALAGGVGRAVRASESIGQDMMYVAVPLVEDGRTVAVVRAARPLTAVEGTLDELYRSIFLAAALVALVAAAVGWVVSARIATPMRHIQEGARRLAAGDLSQRLVVPRTEEIAGIAASLNEMARELDETIRSITRERNEREAVLESMVEGVLAVDTDHRVIAVNPAAARLLGIDAEAVRDQAIEEVTRNPELQQAVDAALDGRGPVEVDLALHVAGRDRFVQANGALLHATGGEVVGAVVVLNDVTRLRRLEGVRRDFVANVSHELKTPVTSIKGFAETLADGALDDPEAARRFLAIIAAQADRLNAIIEDLLALSALEQGDVERSITFEDTRLRGVLDAAVAVCAPKAAAKGMSVHVLCDDGLRAEVSAPLLEQAVVNLIDNAVKYSPGETRVTVACRADTPDDLVIEVVDEGPGIPRDQLPRLFERFYRVDKARSREMGGTGLGLSIVKHIAHAHDGFVTVDSKVGAGSTFGIHVPRAR